MYFKIKHLILWPRNESSGPRVVSFSLDRLNVITGASKTGKSAVIPIVDYCLASDRCSIPVSTIRDACSWFGVVVVTSEGEKLLARREPGTHQSTGEMFVVEAPEVSIPPTILEKNTNVTQVKQMLDRLAGLTNLDLEVNAGIAGFNSRPSFRDLVAFAFQPQNIVANPNVLFFKSDTMEHKEKLRSIFPYVLGAVTADVLAKQWELDRLVRTLRARQRDLADEQGSKDRLEAELQNWLSEARELGLLTVELPAATSRERRVAALRSVAKKTSADVQVSDSSLDVAAVELAELEKEEREAALSLGGLTSRLSNMTQLRATVGDYSLALRVQRERLALSRWLRELSGEHAASCPICGGSIDKAASELNALCDALVTIETGARRLDPAPVVFDKELAQVREQARRYTDQLSVVQSRKRAVESRSARLREDRWASAQIDRFVGKVEQALTLLDAQSSNSGLEQEVDELKARVESLREQLSENSAKARREASLQFVSASMARILPLLNPEHPNAPAGLSIEELTITVRRFDRVDHLWEIGSGANWLSYHVAVMLALHDLFLSQSKSPVPSFIVFDQPSQVYFPRTLAKEAKEGDDPKLERDEDVQAVRRVFSALAQAVSRDSRLQLIVLDHASSAVWGDVQNVQLVEEWRDGEALIPQSWLER